LVDSIMIHYANAVSLIYYTPGKTITRQENHLQKRFVQEISLRQIRLGSCRNNRDCFFPYSQCWNDAIAYCNWLSEMENLPKAYDENGSFLDKDGIKTTDPSKVVGYRLPTEPNGNTLPVVGS